MATVKLLLCVLILLLVICRQDAAEIGPLISVRPSNISFGLSDTFKVSCSFTGDRATNTNVIALALSRANDRKENFTEIAAVTSFSPYAVTLLTNESVQADGLLSQAGKSYLHLRWDYPTGRQAGWYQCCLREVNFTGHCIVKDVDAHVNAGAPNLNDVLEAMQQMRREMVQKDDFVRSLEQQVLFLEQTVSAMDNYTKGIERERESAFEANRKLRLQNSSLSDKGSGIVIDIHPSQVEVGLSDSLDVNCSFTNDGASNMAALISLVLSRADDMNKAYTDIAAVTSFSPDVVNLLTIVTVQADGLLSQTGKSYLHLRWEHPSGQEAGWYQCTTHGVDMIGHNIVTDAEAQVTVSEPNFGDILEAIRQMKQEMAQKDTQIKNLEQQAVTLEQTVSVMDNYTNDLEKNASDMNNYISVLEQNMSILYNYTYALENDVTDFKTNAPQYNVTTLFGNSPLNYGGKNYYLSRGGYQDIYLSQFLCQLFGGTLAEIDDVNEYNAVKNYIQGISGISYVVIGGTDEKVEGYWVLPSTGQPLPFTDWGSGEPDNGRSDNCLKISVPTQFMYDYPCVVTPESSTRFLCELPQ